jgi:ATP-dependent helicase/nuclease subunit B
MTPFLERVSKDIFDSHKIADLQNITVVLPSKRAALYFQNNLAKLSESPFFSPKVWAIDDYIIHKSGFTLLDDLDLYIQLYEIFKEIDDSQPFEKFLTWIPTLVSDFENIDFALLEKPQELFTHMSERLAIEHWGENPISNSSQGYFDFFVKAGQLYFRIQKILLEKKLCYRALAYRNVAQNIDNEINDNTSFHYFVGFNALNIAEEKFMTSFIKPKKGKAVWDTDEYFMEKGHKAGSKLNTYKKSGKYGEWTYQDDFLATSSKKVNIFQINSEALQAKLAKNLAIEHYEDTHAMVVLDENQFKPLILNIPEKAFEFNISIGLPLSNSSFLKFITLILNQNATNSKKISILELRAFFINPISIEILKSELSTEEYKDLKNDVFAKKHFLIHRNTFSLLQKPVFDLFFARNDEKIINKLVNFKFNFEKLIPISSPIDKVGIQFYFEKIDVLKNVNSEVIKLNPFTIKLIWNELIKNQRVSFENKSDSNLQILSMLETRCLDFETVTLLSLNEGILPVKKSTNSFIPYEVKRIFNLPNYFDQDAIMAYHFWRLLKRAKNINFLYLNTKSDLSSLKEKSSFILQFEEILAIRNKNIQISYPVLDIKSTLTGISSSEVCIQKSDLILEKINKYLETKGLSPTSITDYTTCSLKFYWKYIEKIKTFEPESNELKANDIGSIIHKVLENSDQEFAKNKTEINLEDLKTMKLKASELLIEEVNVKYANKEIEQGFNKIVLEMSNSMLESYFDYRIDTFEGNYNVILNESKFTATFPTPYEKFKITGNIDKIEKHGDKFNVIDFKTGSISSNKDLKAEKERQLDIYKYLVFNDKTMEDYFSSSANPEFNFEIIYLLNPEKKLSPTQKNIEEIEKEILEVVDSLISIDENFEQTSDDKKCTYCDFKEICNRKNAPIF